jgi:hypothetical protein
MEDEAKLKHAEYMRDWRLKNLLRAREISRAAAAKYNAANPEKRAASVAAYNERKAAADPDGWKKHKAEISQRSRDRKHGAERVEWLARQNENAKRSYKERVARDPTYLDRKREAGKRWRDANRERYLERSREATRRWRADNPEKLATQNAKYKEKKYAQQLAVRRSIRAALLEFFGGKCVRCGFAEGAGLQLDHINGDGHKDRKAGKGHKREQLALVKLDPDAARAKYQLLCANCNTIKQAENKEYRKPK